MSEAHGGEPGKTVREKIRASYGQIKRFAEPERSPGILVLYNNSGMMGLGRIDHYDVLTAMFGLQSVNVSVQNDGEPTFGPDFLGPKKSVSPDFNRYLSGILTLFEHYERGLIVFFYHNPHAKHPVPRQLLNVPNCIQYILGPSQLNWKKVSCET